MTKPQRLLVLLTIYSGIQPGVAGCADPLPEPTAAEIGLLQTFVEEFVRISPGEGMFPRKLQMGDAESTRECELSGPFSIGKYEVPQNLYEFVMGENPSRWKGPRNSAEQMPWSEATEFCSRVTQLLQQQKLIGDDDVVRLPSEVEWEYCCRAGTETAYSFGDDARLPDDVGPQARVLDEYAWHTGNAAGNDPAVGSLKPNPWGLYDVHGYLWEFCADHWHPDLSHAPRNGLPYTDANPKQAVIRGGSWKDPYPNLTSHARKPFGISERSDDVGFRCVLAPATRTKTTDR